MEIIIESPLQDNNNKDEDEGKEIAALEAV
jgi:hypothetical protein